MGKAQSFHPATVDWSELGGRKEGSCRAMHAAILYAYREYLVTWLACHGNREKFFIWHQNLTRTSQHTMDILFEQC